MVALAQPVGDAYDGARLPPCVRVSLFGRRHAALDVRSRLKLRGDWVRNATEHERFEQGGEVHGES